MKIKLIYVILISVVFLTTGIAIATGSYFGDGLTLKVGDRTTVNIRATGTVENKIATERNRAEAARRAQEMKPLNIHDVAITNRVLDNVEASFNELAKIRAAYVAERERLSSAQRLAEERELERRATEQSAGRLSQEDPAAGESVTEPESAAAAEPEGEIPEATDAAAAAGLTVVQVTDETGVYETYKMFETFPVALTGFQQQYLLQMPESSFEELKEKTLTITTEILNQNISEIDSRTITAVREEFRWSSIDEDATVIGYEIVNRFLEPNYPVDAALTEEQRVKIANEYETVTVRQDEIIVGEYEIVTDEDYAVLQSLGMLNTGLRDKMIPMAGVFILVAALFVACFMYLVFYRKKSKNQRKEAILLCTLYVVILIIVRLLGDVPYQFLPMLLLPMLVSVFVDLRTSILLNLCVTFTLYFVVNGNMEYLLFYTASGTIISLMAKYTTERNKIFLVGTLAALVNFVLSCAVAMITERNNALIIWQDILATAGFAALNGMLTVIVCIGSLPFWETFFGVVTPIKLLDLTNPTNLLLRRMTIEAPGTYHHSLIVANLAETAAYDIGADPHAARVGGYYHDIGKLKFPQYFAENLAGENPHDNMDPYNSVQVIVSHIAYGLTLAAEYRLPQFIRDIIKEHHGTSLIQFFYCKAKDSGGEKPLDESDFRYPYVKPQSRESACVMLADTVEAAIRSMIPRVKSVDEVEEQIRTLIRDKLQDGQLSDSCLSIKDVDIIGESFFRVLKGMYHERIPYPKLTAEEEDKPETPIRSEIKRVFDTGKMPRLGRSATGGKSGRAGSAGAERR
ncbi:MAG: HDIG domain-containing protein, partial [Clostridiales bacterium]|nr:HDIG domain-containing protein [Clostridiales bacterium]